LDWDPIENGEVPEFNLGLDTVGGFNDSVAVTLRILASPLFMFEGEDSASSGETIEFKSSDVRLLIVLAGLLECAEIVSGFKEKG